MTTVELVKNADGTIGTLQLLVDGCPPQVLAKLRWNPSGTYPLCTWHELSGEFAPWFCAICVQTQPINAWGDVEKTGQNFLQYLRNLKALLAAI
jgi:hypothetical protein